MSDYNKNQENQKEPIKKEKEGNVEFRSDEKDEIIKGAKQEDQLDKLNKGDKTRKDEGEGKPVDKTDHSQEKNPNEF